MFVDSRGKLLDYPAPQSCRSTLAQLRTSERGFSVTRMFVSLVPLLTLALGVVSNSDRAITSLSQRSVLNAQQIRALAVGSKMESGPQAVWFNNNGTYVSVTYNVVMTERRGRYWLKGNRICFDGRCLLLAHDRQGYLSGGSVNGRWVWLRQKFVRQGG